MPSMMVKVQIRALKLSHRSVQSTMTFYTPSIKKTAEAVFLITIIGLGYLSQKSNFSANSMLHIVDYLKPLNHALFQIAQML